MGHELVALGSAFVAAGLLGRLGRRLGLPTIPFFIAAGLLLGLQLPVLSLRGEGERLELLAALGLVLLLFHLGLEFDLDGFLRNARALLTAGAGYIVLNVGAGLALGFVLGWGTPEALVIAGVTGISSSAIVTKLLIELRRLTNVETPLILGVMVVEDVFLALYLAMLAPFLGESEGVWQLARTIGMAFLFLCALLATARWGGRHVDRLIGAREDELLTVLFVGVAVLFAGLAEAVGVSDAIGAFMIGLVVAGTSYKDRIERLVLPLRDAFAAIFFFAFGLSLDPAAFGAVLWPVLAAVVVTLAANFAAGLLAARLNGFGVSSGVNAGLTLLSRGEFALILAALAAGAGLDQRIGPFVGLYVVLLAVLGPLLASRSEQIGSGLVRAIQARRRVPAVSRP
jgi:CPA2 family monovalent cation:H+ antiporter-2